MSTQNFDVIVVGAGHAGIEACLASSRLGLSTLLITSNIQRIGYMSCNPAIGGLAKGHMVREIDALGGQMGLATDATTIQFKRLNATKGPAVRGSRSQCDKDKYSKYMTNVVLLEPNLTTLEAEVKKLLMNSGRCVGIQTDQGVDIHAKSVVITTGTFMNAVMHVGLSSTAGGRVGDRATTGLSDQLRAHGFLVQRLKTGTPPRLKASSIDWSKTTPQYGDEKFYPFSFRSERRLSLPQVTCYLSRTTEKTHEIIRENLNKSPIFCGQIEGLGPRYCPSIEDKVTRFKEKISHQTFLEPEGLDTDHIYLQGISTSLPQDIQDQFLRTITGLENVEVLKYGYAVEYDFIEPTQIHYSLETRGIENLFLAGQINGTSGYEEAAAQGFLAGVNAARKILEKPAIVLSRDQAYMGVLVDDLVNKGTKEPYRMFTSRAEYRLILREDNTLDRLYNVSREIGIFKEKDLEEVFSLKSKRQNLRAELDDSYIYPNAHTQEKLRYIGTKEILKPTSLSTLLRRPELQWKHLEQFVSPLETDPDIVDSLEIDIKYSGYIKRQEEVISQFKKLENMHIPKAINYSSIKGLSAEEIEKLERVKPGTLGQAARISGVNPSAIQAILVRIKASEDRGNDIRKSTALENSSVVSTT